MVKVARCVFVVQVACFGLVVLSGLLAADGLKATSEAVGIVGIVSFIVVSLLFSGVSMFDWSDDL